MKNRISLGVIAMFFIGTCFLRAQCVNVGFEDGTFNGWSCAIAKNLTPSNATLGSGPGGYGYANPGGWPHGLVVNGINSNYHKIVSASVTVDSCSTYPGALPKDMGSFRAFIGNNKVDTVKSQEILYKKISVTQLNKFFNYSFLLLFMDDAALHTNELSRPFFEVKVVSAIDSVTVDPCSYNRIDIKSKTYGFNTSLNCATVLPIKYTAWNSEVIDLSGYIGQDVFVVFTLSDCSDGKHKAWAYLNTSCAETVAVNKIYEKCKSSFNLSVPPKFWSVTNNHFTWQPGNIHAGSINVSTSGIYTLIVTDTVHGSPCSKNFIYDVTLIKPVVADFQLNIDTLSTYSMIETSSQGSGVINNWKWFFGDGNVGFGQNIQHKYIFQGTYKACLEIIDSASCVDSSCKIVSVTAPLNMSSCYNDDFEEGTVFGWRPIVTNNFTTMNALWGTESGGYGYSNPSGWPLKNSILTKPIDQTYFKIKDDPNELDTCGLFPVVYTPGKNTLKIGHSYRGFNGPVLTGSNTEQSRVYKKILVTNSNKYFKYNYACVLMIHGGAGNLAAETFFEVKAVLASDSSTVIPQSYLRVIIGSGFAGSKLSSCKNDEKIFRYIPWSMGYIDLSAYIGQEVLVVFTASDCAESGHAAWAYIDSECLSDIPVTKVGTCGGQVTLNATPASNPTYLWQPGNVITPFYKTSTAGIYTLNLTSRFFQDTITKPYLYEVVSTPAIVTSIQSNLLNDSLVNFVGSVSVSAGSIQKWSWNFGDNSSSSIQNPSHTYTHSGSYKACLTATDSLGCSDSSCVTIAVGGTLGVKSIVNTNERVAVYPNPSLDGIFNITSNSEPIVSIAIYNIQGVVIKHIKTNGLNSQLSLNELAGGLYYLNIQTLDGKQFLKKVSYINRSY